MSETRINDPGKPVKVGPERIDNSLRWKATRPEVNSGKFKNVASRWLWPDVVDVLTVNPFGNRKGRRQEVLSFLSTRFLGFTMVGAPNFYDRARDKARPRERNAKSFRWTSRRFCFVYDFIRSCRSGHRDDSSRSWTIINILAVRTDFLDWISPPSAVHKRLSAYFQSILLPVMSYCTHAYNRYK